MSKRWKGTGLVPLLALLVAGVLVGAVTSPAGAAARSEQATLTVVVGNVEVAQPGSTLWRRASLGMKLPQGAQIRAADKSEAEMSLTDGSIVKVTANTRLMIRELTVDPAANVRTSFFHLTAGRIRALVSKAAVALVSGRQSSFAVSTPTAVAAVRGSDVIFAHNPVTNASSFASFRGPMAIMDNVTMRQVFNGQGQATRVTPGSPPSQPAPMPANVQAGMLTNAPIRTASPQNPPVISPVAAVQTSAPATAVAGAPATAPPPPAPPTAQDMVNALLPPAPPPAAPPPPAAQVTQISPAITLPPPPPAPTTQEVAALAAPTVAPPVVTTTSVTESTVPTVVSTPPPVTVAPPPPVTVAPPTVVDAPPPAVAPPPVVIAPPPAPTAPTVTNPGLETPLPPPPSES